MSDYFSLITLVTPLDRTGLRRMVRLACLELYRVEWLRSYLSADGTRMLCWYRAPDAEAVRLIHRQQETPGAPVWAGKVHAPNEGQTQERECTVLAFASEPENRRDAVSLRVDSVQRALGEGGLSVCQAFCSPHGDRIFCIVEGTHDPVVFESLAPAEIWCGVELDPRPVALFGAELEGSRGALDRPAPEASSQAHRPARGRDGAESFDAVIIGAGLSGICMLERLNRMGLRARVYEQASDVGGVWYWNRYPGARVDSESFTYGYSFSDTLLREWEWQELFAPQAEIARYVTYAVDRLELRAHIRFDTRVTRAAFDERSSRWSIATDSGEQVTARYLISASGTLSAPQMPDYPGLDSFAGESHHTARWPARGVELAGRRVGVIGTGATGVQVIQTIAGEVGHLTVFQRTPTYCMPQRNRALTDADRARIQRDWQVILATCRESYGGFIHAFDPQPGLALSIEEREARFEALWQQPGFAFWLGNFGDLMMSHEVNAHACDFVRRKILERVHDPEVAAKLLPTHPLGAKRVPLENGYYEVYNRANVTLVDLRETPIERITPVGIRTSAGEHRLDVIVYATGFDAGTGTLMQIDIRGEKGETLAEKWRAGPATYLGLLVCGFPNFFMVNGPQNAAAFCNAGRCVEQNVDWIARCIETLRARRMNRIVPTAAAEEEWTRHVDDTAEASVLAQMKESWFYGANTPGKPRRITIYAGGAREYREHCEAAARAGYPGLRMS